MSRSNGKANEMSGLLEQYLEWLRIHNSADNTIRGARRSVNGFITWAAEQGITRARHVTRPILEKYQSYLYQRPQARNTSKPLDARTQHGYLGCLRAWFKWLARNNHILYSPAADMELPHYNKRLPKHWLSVGEAEQILNVPDVDMPLGVRDRAMLETLYSTGIRRMELVRLRLTDLDTERGVVVVREGKGGKDRVVPIGERAVQWITRYVKDVRPRLLRKDRGIDYLFLTVKGGPFRAGAMSDLMRRYVTAAELGKSGSCHLWRHTMATVMHENGADILDLQAILGHASVETTAIYTKVAIARLKEVHNETHPAKPEA